SSSSHCTIAPITVVVTTSRSPSFGVDRPIRGMHLEGPVPALPATAVPPVASAPEPPTAAPALPPRPAPVPPTPPGVKEPDEPASVISVEAASPTSVRPQANTRAQKPTSEARTMTRSVAPPDGGGIRTFRTGPYGNSEWLRLAAARATRDGTS